MNWNQFSSEEELDKIKELSFEKPQAIFKHSTRCSISSMAKNRLDRANDSSLIDFNYLDLIANRNISAKIAEMFNVEHESPQILVIKNGECIYDESHNAIAIDEILEQVS